MDQTVGPSGGVLTHAQIRLILLGLVLAMFLGALDQTIVATALPTIGRELLDVQNLSWVVTAYLLTSTAVTPLYGKLSDVHGRRLMLLIAIVVFLTGSVACALSHNIFMLIAARAFQGLGGGGLISLGQTIIGDVIAPRERGRYQAYFAAVFVTSSIAGPVLGGFFAEHLHWSFIFWINLPIGIAAYAMTTRVLRALPRNDRPHRIDLLGAVLMVAATVALLMALSWGGTEFAWASIEILGLVAASVVFWVLFALRLVMAPEPFIPLSTLGNPVVRMGVGATFFAVGCLVGMSVYMPLYFEAVLELTAAESGVALIALMGGTVFGATLTGRIMVRSERYKRPTVIGLALATLVGTLLSFLPANSPLWLVETVLAVMGMGIGTVFPVTTTSVQNAVPVYQMGTATGILNFARSLGGAILVAVLGAIFLANAVSDSSLASVQKIVTEGKSSGIDFAHVFTGVFLAATISLLLSLVFIVLMEERPLRTHIPRDDGHGG